MNFGVIEEENKYEYDGFDSSQATLSNNFVSGHIPEVEAFEIGKECGGFGEFPTHTPVASTRPKHAKAVIDENRNSTGINGLLELAGTSYQMDQIGEEGE